MERLTEEKQIGPFASLKEKAEAVPGAFGTYDCLYSHMVAVTRLKEYEDTGLEPEEIAVLCSMSESAKMADLLRLEEYQALGSIGHLRELAQAEKDGRLVVLPCRAGDTVLVDVRTLPYNYLHPCDRCGDYAKCEIVSIVTTKKKTYMKLRALYSSRARKREYLKYGVTAIGKTVFLTHPQRSRGGAEKEGGGRR